VRLLIAGALGLLSLSAQAQVKGGLTCPNGSVEAKSLGAYYVPAKGALTIFFFKEDMKEHEMDAILANAAKFDAGDKAKGPGMGKRARYVPYAFKAWTRVSTKPDETVTAADFVQNVYYSYVCETTEAVVKPDMKQRAAKAKAAFPDVTAELTQGGKIAVTTKGAYDGDPKTKYAPKVSWDIQGTGKLRVYE
jgi:hypothetical protein